MYDHYQRAPKRRTWPFILFAAFLLGVTLFSLRILVFRQSTIISPISEEGVPQKSILSIFTKKKSSKELKKAIETEVGNDWKNYSILIKDYKSDFILGINDAVIYTAASVNKIPILAALYYFAQTGEVNLDQEITLQAADIQEYGTGVIQNDPPGTVYSVKTLARLMIQKSDNTAAYILGNYVVGLDKVQTLMSNWGLTQTDMINNKTSNKDMAILFEKVVSGKVANKALTDEMLSFLKDSDFEDRIPGELPKDVNVYHKTGTEVRTIHDVGIVTDGTLSYYVGIFTTDVPDEEEAGKKIARISKIIFDFMR